MTARLPAAALVAAVGGSIGALARWGVSEWLAPEPGVWPWATFVVNLLGCLLAGVVIGALVDRPRVHPLARPFLLGGVLGGFTTFSAVAVEVQDLIAAGGWPLAAAYVVSSLLIGIALVTVGRWVGRR